MNLQEDEFEDLVNSEGFRLKLETVVFNIDTQHIEAKNFDPTALEVPYYGGLIHNFVKAHTKIHKIVKARSIAFEKHKKGKKEVYRFRNKKKTLKKKSKHKVKSSSITGEVKFGKFFLKKNIFIFLKVLLKL